jgi:hypothetical protein
MKIAVKSKKDYRAGNRATAKSMNVNTNYQMQNYFIYSAVARINIFVGGIFKWKFYFLQYAMFFSH